MHYRALPALHARDCEPEGFEWLIADDNQNSVYAWARHSGGGDPPVVVVSNFTPVPREDYVLPCPGPDAGAKSLNTDAAAYGGSGLGNMGAIQAEAVPSHGKPASAKVTLAAAGNFVFPV